MSDQLAAGQSQDPCDINGAHFQHEDYLEKMFKEKSLSELMDKETEIVKREFLFTMDIDTQCRPCGAQTSIIFVV